MFHLLLLFSSTAVPQPLLPLCRCRIELYSLLSPDLFTVRITIKLQKIINFGVPYSRPGGSSRAAQTPLYGGTAWGCNCCSVTWVRPDWIPSAVGCLSHTYEVLWRSSGSMRSRCIAEPLFFSIIDHLIESFDWRYRKYCLVVFKLGSDSYFWAATHNLITLWSSVLRLQLLILIMLHYFDILGAQLVCCLTWSWRAGWHQFHLGAFSGDSGSGHISFAQGLEVVGGW